MNWVQADLLDWQPEPDGYDLVLIAYLHLPSAELTRVFRAAAAAVAPGGTLLAVGHDRENVARGHGEMWFARLLLGGRAARGGAA